MSDRGSSTTPMATQPMPLSTPKLRRKRPLSTYNFTTPARLSSSSPPLSSPVPAITTTTTPHLTINHPPAPENDGDIAGSDTLSSSLRGRSRSRENSSSRSKSKSPGGGSVFGGVWKKDLGQDAPENAASTSMSWWSLPHMQDLIPRPWGDSQRWKMTVPAEQTEAWARTREVRFFPRSAEYRY